MDTTEKIQPALTAKEWASDVIRRPGTGADYVKLGVDRLYVVEGDTKDGEDLDCGEVDLSDPSAGHAMAALALEDQPFGFTQEDVKALRFFAKLYFEDRGPTGEGWRSDEGAAAQDLMPSLADRIEALLPPESHP